MTWGSGCRRCRCRVFGPADSSFDSKGRGPMAAIQNGSLRLFRVAGVDVMIHWSWIILAAFETQIRGNVFNPPSPYWDAALFLTGFFIIMLHEIGHLTACRQVVGTADLITLFPSHDIAIINPP